jgi:hypothetical protein
MRAVRRVSATVVYVTPQGDAWWLPQRGLERMPGSDPSVGLVLAKLGRRGGVLLGDEVLIGDDVDEALHRHALHEQPTGGARAEAPPPLGASPWKSPAPFRGDDSAATDGADVHPSPYAPSPPPARLDP